tara:strand:- start:130 stop:489 length:360 start_codon:yes stop_codon:yes gene_type:complete
MNQGYEVKGLGTHVLGSWRLLVSRDDSQDLRKKFGNDSESEEESHCLSHYDAKCQNPAVAPAVGFEPTEPPFNTNELAPHAHLYAHLNCADLQELVQSWENLPKTIQEAIMAIVRNNNK